MADDNTIDEKTAMRGIIDAADEIGHKQIRPVLNQIQSDNYEPIFEGLVKNKLLQFKLSELKQLMHDVSDNIIKNFVYKMVDLGIFEHIGHENSGRYKFSNTLYYTYFLIKSIEKSND